MESVIVKAVALFLRTHFGSGKYVSKFILKVLDRKEDEIYTKRTNINSTLSIQRGDVSRYERREECL